MTIWPWPLAPVFLSVMVLLIVTPTLAAPKSTLGADALNCLTVSGVISSAPHVAGNVGAFPRVEMIPAAGAIDGLLNQLVGTLIGEPRFVDAPTTPLRVTVYDGCTEPFAGLTVR